MTDQYNLGELTKEMVASRLKSLEDAPAVAAEIVKKTIVAGVQGTRHAGQSPQVSVQQICRGAVAGLLLIDKDLPKSAVCMLDKMAEASQEIQLAPEDLMTWAMEGIASMANVIPLDVQGRIRDAINDKYMGAGEVFEKLCLQHKKG